MKKRVVSILMCGVLALSFSGCSYNVNLVQNSATGSDEAVSDEVSDKEATEAASEEVVKEESEEEKSGEFVGERSWDTEIVVHPGFRDLGEYIIELPDYDDESFVPKAVEAVNSVYDQGEMSPAGCTAMITTDPDGNVIVGRNMDLEISQYPAFIYKTTYAKYKTFCVSYAPSGPNTYAEIQQMDYLDEHWQRKLLLSACDCMNEKGLYIEENMRNRHDAFINRGLHTSRGEITRDDGTPWSELRMCTTTIPQMVAQNCATVEEAIEFLNNSYDWYTITAPGKSAYDGWNLAFAIGDATGEYGIIEVAADEVSYIPHQFGHANFYLTPKWNILETFGNGIGRLSKVSQVIGSVTNMDEAMDAMKDVMWRNETLWLGESERIEDGTRPNLYNQVVFKDDKGNPSMDWRSEYTQEWPVLDDGRMLITQEEYQNAKDSTYDEKILEYYDDAIARDEMVIDDGSIKFAVNGEELTYTELTEKYYEFILNYDDLEKQKELRPYYEALNHLFDNENTIWGEDDHHFEAIKAAAYAGLHIRYDEEGNVDPSCMSRYEKLLAFYGYGTDKDEMPLRDDASIWTTALNVGASCADRTIKIRFFENDNLVYTGQFK